MRFAAKVFLATVAVIAVSLAIVGYMLVSAQFEQALRRETFRALDEHLLLKFAFETAADIAPEPDAADIEQIGRGLNQGIRRSERIVRILDEAGNPLYQSSVTRMNDDWLPTITDEVRRYRVVQVSDQVYIQVLCRMRVGGRVVFFEADRDITAIYQQRAAQFVQYRRWTLLLLAAGALVMAGVSLWLTRPLRALTATTRRIATGEYHERAAAMGHDEIGEFTHNFNAMADALEAHIHLLEDAARQREDFVASFAHELKTPLTSIIGYADMLRSQTLSAHDGFKAASYIFSEGKRLESLSLKLLELIVLGRSEFELKPINAALLIEAVEGVMKPALAEQGLTFICRADEAVVQADGDLLKTLLMNLVDNARKASAPGERIWLEGAQLGAGYAFTVRDEGRGIPQDEIGRITQAFYMVDKSRARAQNGAGLGLALCAEIARLHSAELTFDSAVDSGTTVQLRMGMQRPLFWRKRRTLP